MQVEFDVNLDDVIDAQVRASKASKFLARTKLRSSLYMGVVAALIGYVLVDLIDAIVHAHVDQKIFKLPGKIAVSLVSGGIASLLWFLLYDWNFRINLKKYAAEQYGAEPINYWIDLSPQGIRVKRKKVEALFNWGHIKRIRLGIKEIDLHIAEGAIIPILGRAFDSFREMERFYELAVQYRDEWSRSTAVQELRQS